MSIILTRCLFCGEVIVLQALGEGAQALKTITKAAIIAPPNLSLQCAAAAAAYRARGAV